MRNYPSIPEPGPDLQSLQASILAIKQVLEILLGQRGKSTEQAAVKPDITYLQQQCDAIDKRLKVGGL